MAQTVEELAEILNNLNLECKNNAEEFDKALKGIGSKLDLILDDKEMLDSVKVYISDLKDAIEIKNDYASSLLDSIETSVSKVIQNQEAGAKTSQIRDLFQLLNANIELFSSKISAQGDLIAQIEEDIISLKSQTDNSENLAENIVDIKKQITDINSKVYESFERVNENISSTIQALESIDISTQTELMRQNLVVIKDSYASVLEILKVQDEKIVDVLSALEKIPSVEDFGNISAKIGEMDAFLIASNNANNQKIDEEFDILDNSMAAISEKISSKTDLITSFMKESDEQKLENLKNISKNIDSLQEIINSANIEYKALLEERVVGIKSYMSDIGDSLYSSYSEGSSLLNEKLSSLDELSHGFESSLINVNVNLQNILKNILAIDSTEQNDIIKRELENIYISANAILTSLKISDQKNDEIVAMITNLNNCEELEKINNTLDNIIISLDEKFSNIESLPSKDDIAQLDEKFNIFTSSIQELRDIILKLSSENKDIFENQLNNLEEKLKISVTENNFSQFRKDLADFIQKVLDNSAALHINSEDMKLKISDIYLKLKEQDCSSDVKDLVADVKNLSGCLTGISENVISEVRLVSQNITEMKDEFVKLGQENNEKVSGNIEIISSKLDNIQDNLAIEVANSFSDMKDIFSGLTENINAIQEGHSQFINDLSQTQDAKISEVAEDIKNIENYIQEFSNSGKQNLSDAVEDLKTYIKDIDLATKNSKSLSDEKFAEKLLAIEALISNNVDSYQTDWDLLKTKLYEYVQIVDKVNTDTESKLDSSLVEINTIKSELISLSEELSKNFSNGDEKFEQVISLLDAGVKSVSDSIAEMNLSMKDSVGTSIKDGLVNLDEKFNNLLSLVDVLKTDSDSSRQNLASSIGDKFETLKQELDLVRTDIADVYSEKIDTIISAFEELKTNIDAFVQSDILKILSEVKEQLDVFYMNISSDLVNGFAENQESITDLEQVYKESFNRLSEIEDCLKSDTQENLELIKIAVNTVDKHLKNSFDDTNSLINEWNDAILQLNEKIALAAENNENSLSIAKEEILRVVDEKLNLYIDDLKSHIGVTLNTEDTMLAIDGLKHELADKFASLLIDFASGKEKTESLGKEVDNLKDLLKNCIKEESNKIFNSVTEVSGSTKKTEESLTALNEKIDLLFLSNDGQDENKYDEAFETLNAKIDVIASDSSISELNEKVDLLLLDNDSRDENHYDEAFETLNAKIDVIASDSSISELSEKLDDISIVEDKLEETLMALHQKVDTLALFNDSEDFDAQEEIEDIKNLIISQRQYFESSGLNERTEAISSCLEDLLSKIQNIENGLGDVDLEKNTQDIKESIMAAIISVFEQVSFVEETEEIKDFVEEKTDEINNHLKEVREQLKQITSGNSDGFDYSYTLQDVESDIAKLRIALNEISNSTSKDDINELSSNINRIAHSVEGLQSSLTPAQMFELKEDIEKLNEDIISISSRTNKLLLTSDESYRALSSGLDRFSNVVSDLEEKISYIDYTEVNERFEKKIDAIKSMLIASANTDRVFHQVLMYLGEWIDSTSENISSISEKVSEINNVKDMIEELRVSIPDKSYILDELEEKFEMQESRIDRLEMKIEKIISTLEEKDDMMLNNKVDKIEKQLSRLSVNIEKLASYVDEE